MNKKLFFSLILFGLLFFTLNVSAEILSCKYIDEKGNLKFTITFPENPSNYIPANIYNFWDKKDVTFYYKNYNEKFKECPKYALAVAKNIDGSIFFANTKEELENQVNNNEDWTFENPGNVEKNWIGIPNKSSAVIGFFTEKGTALDKNSQRVCSYDETIIGCDGCQIDLTFTSPLSGGTDSSYEISVLTSYATLGNISTVIIDENQWKVKPKLEGQGNFSYISPIKGLSSFCPDDLFFKYDPSQETLYVFPNEETSKNINVEEKTTTTLRHNYVGENFCSDIEVQKVLRLAGYLLIIVKIVVPLILIVLGTLDLYKVVTGKDDKDLSKSIKTLVFRLILGIFIFFIPTIVNYMFDLLYESEGDNNKQCVECLLNPSSCNITEKTEEKNKTESTSGFADENGKCPENYSKGIDGICYKKGVCGSYLTKDECPDNCKWSTRNGCQLK